MATGLWTWSKTAATNASSDSAINWQEGQSPGSVNGSAREMMAALARWRDDISGNLVTGGTATALTVTSNQVFTSLDDGISITVRMTVTNGTAATLNVDSLGAKAIASVYGTAMAYGALPAGSIQRFTYDSTDDKWIAHNAREKVFQTGFLQPFLGGTAPDGWVISNGNTIGNASSNASNRANADCEDLFTRLWNSCANTEAAIYTSGGIASTRGANAAADWAANKAIATINMAGATFAGLDDLGIGDQGRISVVTPANGKVVGTDTTTLSESQIPQITPAGTNSKPAITITNGTGLFKVTGSLVTVDTGSFGLGGPSGGSSVVTATAALDNAPAFTGTQFGGGQAHSNMQPTVFGYWLVKL